MESGFSESLAALWAAANRPTLAAIVRGARSHAPSGWSASGPRISEWRSGKHIPARFDDVAPVIAWLENKAVAAGTIRTPRTRERWEQVWRDARNQATDSASRQSAGSPYLGLVPLGPDDAAVLFGRDETVADLLAVVADTREVCVQTGAPAIVVVSGRSGVGKSSLLRAGLASRLGRGCVVITPGDQPGRRLSAAVEQLGVGTDTALVIDQFEECFTLTGRGERDEFIARVIDIARSGGDQPSTTVVLGVRADLYADVIRYDDLAQAWQTHSLVVPAMRDDQLREVIERPAATVGASLEPGLADIIIDDLRSDRRRLVVAGGASPVDTEGNSDLPLVAYTMRRLWEQRTRRQVMTTSTYTGMGRVTGAVADIAETVWRELDQAQRARARSLLLALVRILADGRIGQQPQPIPTDPVVTDLVERLAAARLLVIGRDRVEVGHEAVFSAWPRYREWIGEERSAAAHVHEVDVAAAAWIDAGRPKHLLYGRRQLDRVATTLSSPLADRHPIDVFVVASAARVRRTTMLLRATGAGVCMIAIVAVVAASIAVVQTSQVTRSRDDARFASLLSSVDSSLADSPSAAARLAAAAWTLRPDDPHATVALLRTQNMPLATSGPGHGSTIYDIAVSTDGRTAVTASNDRSIGVWSLPVTQDRRTGEAPRMLASVPAHQSFVTSVAVSPDGKLLASAGGDGMTTLWDIAVPTRPRPLGSAPRPAGVTGANYLLRFHPNQPRLAGTSDDGTVTMWDISSSARPRILQSRRDTQRPVRTLAFSPTGETLATGSDDRALRTYRVGADGTLFTGSTVPDALPSSVHSMAMSGDGRYLAAGGDDGTVGVWNVGADGGLTLHGNRLRRQHQAVWALAFAPGDDLLLSGSLDSTGAMWDVTPDGLFESGRPSLTSNESTVQAAVFLDRSTALTAGSSGGLTSWSLSDQSAPLGDGAVLAPEAADGGVVATVDERTRLWRVPDNPFAPPIVERDAATTLRAQSGNRMRAALSPDGSDVTLVTTGVAQTSAEGGGLVDRALANRYSSVVAYTHDGRLVTVGDDSSIQLWPAGVGTSTSRGDDRPEATWRGPELLFALAAAPDRPVVAVAGENGPIYLWDGDRPSQPHRALTGHSGPVIALAFSPDGERLYSVGRDGTLRTWDLRSGDEPTSAVVELPDSIVSLAVNPSGDSLVAASNQRAYLFDIDDAGIPTSSAPVPIIEAGGTLRGVVYADTSRLTLVEDSSLRQFTVQPEAVVDRICGATRPLTRAEWNAVTDLAERPPNVCR